MDVDEDCSDCESDSDDNEMTEAPGFKCYQCGEVFDNRDALYAHFDIHTRKEESTQKISVERKQKKKDIDEFCSKCNLQFKNRSNYLRHVRAVHMGIQYICNFCDKKCARSDILKKHKQENCPVLRISCFPNKSPWQKHSKLLKRDPEIFSNVQKTKFCHWCKRRFSDSLAYDCHLRINHHQDIYSCKACNQVFPTVLNFKEHFLDCAAVKRNLIKMYAKPMTKSSWEYICYYCSEVSSDRSYILDHLDIHISPGMSPPDIEPQSLQCPSCLKKWKTLPQLKYHIINKHSNCLTKINWLKRKAFKSPDIYVCSKCGYHFSKLELLMRHSHTCGNSLPSKKKKRRKASVTKLQSNDMIEEKKIGRTEHDIDKGNTDKPGEGSLVEHVNLLSVVDDCSDLKEYDKFIVHIDGSDGSQCLLCGYVTSSSDVLRSHISTFHFRHRPFQCNLCFRCYKRTDFWMNHMIKHHNINPEILVQTIQEHKGALKTKNKGGNIFCTVCDSPFVNHKTLLKHVKSVHKVNKRSDSA